MGAKIGRAGAREPGVLGQGRGAAARHPAAPPAAAAPSHQAFVIHFVKFSSDEWADQLTSDQEVR